MATAFSKFIIRTLCDNQGCLDFQQLNEKITQSFTVAESVLRDVLFDNSKMIIQEGQKKAVGSQMMSPDSLVVVKTSLRLCQKKECVQCDGLHLCRYFVCGDCMFRHKCRNPHSLASPHNAELLRRHGLQDLTEKQLFQLLLQNDSYLLPEICPHYNKGNGPHGSCKFTTTCNKLHMCQHHLQGNCKFGSNCKRRHKIDALGLFKGFSQENIANLHKIYRNKLIILDQQERRPSAVRPEVSSANQSNPISDADRNEICLFFIRRNCSFKEKCARVHWRLPYRWQVLDGDGVSWKDLPNMEDTEKAYCDPKHDTRYMHRDLHFCLYKGPDAIDSSHLLTLLVFSSAYPDVKSVDFTTMTYGGSPVRRLSTPSSVSKPPHFILTTQWLWYWKDDNRKWLEFGQGDNDSLGPVTSQTLENVYLADRDTEIPFSAGKQQYILHFRGAPGTQQMDLQNVKDKTKREVRRRPRFVSGQDVELKLNSASSHSSSSSTAESFPSYWDKNALPDFGYRLINLSKSAEYNNIETLFKRTMPHSSIKKIQRIQNPSLWRVFQWEKEQMKQRNGGKAVNQQYLFHGTDKSLIESICEKNFDCRICDVHGTTYGRGTVIQLQQLFQELLCQRCLRLRHVCLGLRHVCLRLRRLPPKLRQIYRNKPDQDHVCCALVLVGEYTRGSRGYVRPPPKGNTRTLYDSCVDHESDPSIFVIFEKQQIYPEMTSVVSKFIIRTLCDNQGCLDFQQLNEKITQSFTVAESVLRSVLFDDGKIVVQEGRLKCAGGQMMSPDSLVLVKTSLRLCQKKPGECVQCDGLHLCRYFVCGDCMFGQKCKNHHSVASTYNAELLRRHGLQDLTEKQLFQLLLQNDPYLLPEICPHYNKGNGPHGSCKFTTTCNKLHMCQHHLQGDCKFGSRCKRSHNIDAHGLKILKGFSQENIANLHKIYRNKLIIMDQQERRPSTGAVRPEVRIPTQQPSHSSPGSPVSPTSPSNPISDADRNEICLFFIRRNCSFKEKCARVHWHLPYRWQVLDGDGVTWKDLPDMEDTEKAYCDPEPLHTPDVKSVDFTTMTYGGSPVRRLSTPSSVSKPPHFILTTQWLWYWKDDNRKWFEFGQGDHNTPASITSQTLENVYLADRDTEIPFSAGKQQYILHFRGAPGTQQMYQQNVKYNTKREVRRRPRFVSGQDVELKLNSASSHSSSSSTAESFPSYWDKNALPDFGYRLVNLSKSAEYNNIETLFKRTMPHSSIKKIQRIQNPSLWRVFQWQKEQMQQRNGGKPVNQQYLFHGTDKSLIEAICEQNFDWRMCGVHGTAYGRGSYFARDASYSDRYASVKTSQTKTMFVALVLVGEYTRGSSSYVRPPPKGNTRTFYDSCVNHESDPSIFVIFEKQQIYPEYVIEYS
ncbi:hypothetical protein L3Q82_024132 [Scortum barcoo]|uniref:Uncharacterized protein n=1 Tax=Scortum barcoo TaxID=214431 RepID=A0ACB8WVH3_9TELE|nr:hypothetical protein L3Q82_024132 [Scortum barcoo]